MPDIKFRPFCRDICTPPPPSSEGLIPSTFMIRCLGSRERPKKRAWEQVSGQTSKQTNKQKTSRGGGATCHLQGAHGTSHAIKRIWIASCTNLVSIVRVFHLPIMGNNGNNVTLLSCYLISLWSTEHYIFYDKAKKERKHAKKVLSDSLVLVDFTIGLVNFAQVSKLFWEIQITEKL